MTYLDKKNLELKELAKNYEQGLRNYVDGLNKKLTEMDWKSFRYEILLDCLKENNFEMAGDVEGGTLYINKKRRKDVVIPKHKPEKRKQQREEKPRKIGSLLKKLWSACVTLTLASFSGLKILNAGGYYSPVESCQTARRCWRACTGSTYSSG